MFLIKIDNLIDGLQPIRNSSKVFLDRSTLKIALSVNTKSFEFAWITSYVRSAVECGKIPSQD